MDRYGLALAFALLLTGRAALTGQAIDMSLLLEHAESVLEQDHAAWRNYAFHRYVSREKLNKKGNVVWSTEYHFEVTPEGSGFDERLTEIDGREPTPVEILEHRGAGRFEKRYQDAGSLRNPFGKEIPLLPLLFEQRHEYVGRRVIRGQPCRMTKFAARNPPSRLPARRRLAYVLEGEACFSFDGDHLVVADMETARAVSAGLVKLQHLRVRIEVDPVGDDRWLPIHFEVRSDVRLGMKRLRKANLYQYSHYRLEGP